MPSRRPPRTQTIWAEFSRQPNGLEWETLRGWHSNGGPARLHPARTHPFTLEVDAPSGEIHRLSLVGVFALYATPQEEPRGGLGASVQLVDDPRLAYRLSLVSGRHYGDPYRTGLADRLLGDGASLEEVGTVETPDGKARVDRLQIDLPQPVRARRLVFKDLGTPASFVLFQVGFEVQDSAGCPFHGRAEGIALSELGMVVRLGDRVRFARALDQLREGLKRSADIDEARSMALTFLAVVSAAMLEVGAPRETHLLQLRAAREFDRRNSSEEVWRAASRFLEEVAPGLFGGDAPSTGSAVDRALQLLERNYARRMTDAEVARQLGLSTSHFRFLFKQATGKAFHQYLVATRLERAQQLLLTTDLPVGEVAKAVGYPNATHFSRAYARQFGLSPTAAHRAHR